MNIRFGYVRTMTGKFKSRRTKALKCRLLCGDCDVNLSHEKETRLLNSHWVSLYSYDSHLFTSISHTQLRTKIQSG